MKVLGIHFQTHDTGVALIDNGKILFAASNERFSRVKMDRQVPILAIRACLSYCHLQPKDIDEVVFVGRSGLSGLTDYIKESTRSLFLTKGMFPFWHQQPHLVLQQLMYASALPSYIKRQLIPTYLLKRELSGFGGSISYVPHHMAHVYSAYYTSGWSECLVGVIEGAGYDLSTSFWSVSDGVFTPLTQVSLPHSAGRFYELITLLLGFNRIKHAGKITGLAAYGNPNTAYPVVKKLLWTEGGQLRLDYNKYYKWQAQYSANKKLPKELSHFSREDLAAAFQRRLEEVIVDMVKNACHISGQHNIALAGGVVSNVKLNQKIHELKEIENIHISQAMGDDGLALGAALFAWAKRGSVVKRSDTIYFGPDFSDIDIKSAISSYQVKFQKIPTIERKVAQLLKEGKVIAHFNGRMEFGPRALGNRTILYQTTDPKVNTWLNKQLKRTEFMPFAPVTLDRFAEKCYMGLKGAEYSARFMTITFECTPYMKKVSPAVVHVDNTARPQIIRKQDNPQYYKILEEYFKLTGIPSLVNTSFNMHEEPIVCSPSDAIRAFLSSGLDYLVLGKYLITQHENSLEV